ncbi:MAG: hypothetical protein ACD_22C00224G0001 [uncultured bacterium]|nr:MAG: hypothetical protein ACD_22C00224G0001 [uncultured bacterium]
MRYLFYVVNGIGIGHLCRMLGVADAVKKLEPTSEILFISEVDDPQMLKEHGYAYFYVPPLHRLLEDSGYKNLPSDPLIAIRNSTIDSVILNFQPNAIVHDTLTDSRIIKMGKVVGAKQVLILRLHKDMSTYISKNYDLLKDMSLIALPYQNRDEVPLKLFSRLQEKLILVGPILRRSLSQIDTTSTKNKYQINDSRFTIVISNGGGSDLHGYLDSFWETISHVFYHKDLQNNGIDIIAITGPLTSYTQVFKNNKIKIVQFEPKLIDLFASSNLVIARGGFNTVLELAIVGVPSICIPAWRKSDNQDDRVVQASEKFPNILNANLDPADIYQKILSISKSAKWRFQPQMDDPIENNKKYLAGLIIKQAT